MLRAKVSANKGVPRNQKQDELLAASGVSFQQITKPDNRNDTKAGSLPVSFHAHHSLRLSSYNDNWTAEQASLWFMCFFTKEVKMLMSALRSLSSL